MSYDEHGVDKTMSCDELQDAAMDNLAVEAMTLQAKCDLLKSQLDETAANQGRIQFINAMFIGQFSRLMYAFNPEGEQLDPVDPDKNLEAVVSDFIDQAIDAFTDAKNGYELARHVNVLTESVRDHQKYQSSIRKAIVDSGLLEGVRDLDSMHLDETVEELIRITRRWISGRDEWMREAVRNADSAAEAERRLGDARNTIVEGLRLLRFPPSRDPMKCGNYEEISLEAATKMMIDTIDGLEGGISSSNAREFNLMGTIREMEGALDFIRGFVAGREGATSSTSRLVQEDLRAIVDDVKATVESRAALEVDANNLWQINRCLTITLSDMDNLLENIGFHGERMTEEHMSANAQRIFFDAVEAITELKELRTKVESLKALKIDPVSTVSEAWDALRRAGVRTEDHATLADAIIHLDQWNNDEIKGDLKRRREVIEAAWRALNTIEGMKLGEHGSLADAIRWLGYQVEVARGEIARVRSETHTEFVNGVLTVHTEGATVIIVDRNA